MGIKLIRYLPSVIWMGVIFYLSHQPASKSADTSQSILTNIVKIVPISTEHEIVLHMIVRKLAHFVAYMILGLLIYFAYKGSHAVVFTLIICLLFAITDEVHQLFIPGRSGEIRDVLIDVSGAAFGLIVLKIISKVRLIFEL